MISYDNFDCERGATIFILSVITCLSCTEYLQWYDTISLHNLIRRNNVTKFIEPLLHPLHACTLFILNDKEIDLQCNSEINFRKINSEYNIKIIFFSFF